MEQTPPGMRKRSCSCIAISAPLPVLLRRVGPILPAVGSISGLGECDSSLSPAHTGEGVSARLTTDTTSSGQRRAAATSSLPKQSPAPPARLLKSVMRPASNPRALDHPKFVMSPLKIRTLS